MLSGAPHFVWMPSQIGDRPSWDGPPGSGALHNAPTRERPGTACLSSSRYFAVSSGAKRARARGASVMLSWTMLQRARPEPVFVQMRPVSAEEVIE